MPHCRAGPCAPDERITHISNALAAVGVSRCERRGKSRRMVGMVDLFIDQPFPQQPSENDGNQLVLGPSKPYFRRNYGWYLPPAPSFPFWYMALLAETA